MRITYNVPVPRMEGRISAEAKAIDEFNAGRNATMCLECDDLDTAQRTYINALNRIRCKGYAIRVKKRGLRIYLEKIQ